jgi:GNAT superfamily N-acetyltransferase
MQTTKVKHTTATDEANAIDTIVLAFAADPMARWSWPDSRQYLASMPDFARAFGGGAFQHDSAYCSEDYAGASLWLPPNVQPDEEAIGDILQQTISASIRDDLFTIFEQMASYHPNEPHWYLPLIGVDPAYQGRGYGGALLAYALRECDRQHLPAYLESTNPKNIPLYQRHGFEVIGTIQVGGSPPLTPMLRRAR